MRISIIQFVIFLVSALFWPSSIAQEKTSGLQCVADQLASCKLTNTAVNATALKEYSKAFNCVKYGSTSGTNFNVNIPVPKVGLLGFGFGDSAQYSTDMCKEEIKKLETSTFVKTFGESFSADCGKTLAGQYEQCLKAKVALETLPAPTVQGLQCNAVQSSRNVVINLRYTPAVGESPANYAVNTVTGVTGMTCEKGVAPGIHAPSSMHCDIPASASSEVAIVRLANTVSCQVPLRPERSIEISSAKKHSCAAILGKKEILGELPNLVRYNAIGMCDSCLSANLNTPDTDQRTLTNRLRSCVIWATQAVIGSSFCSVPEKAVEGFGNPFSATPPAPVMGAVLPNPFGGSPGDADITFGYIAPLNASALQMNVMTEGAKQLCSKKSNVDVLQRPSEGGKSTPIDFLGSSAGQNPMFADLIKAVDLELK